MEAPITPDYTGEVQGLKQLNYGVPSTQIGSLAGRQGELIDLMLSGNWRTMIQQNGNEGSVDSPTPSQVVATETGIKVANFNIPIWAVALIGFVVAGLFLKGK